MSEYRIEMNFNWNSPPSFFLVAGPIRQLFLPKYQEIAQSLGVPIAEGFYTLQNGVVEIDGTRGIPRWFTQLRTGLPISFCYFDSTGDQVRRELLLPIVAFSSIRLGDPRAGDIVYPMPPIDTNRIAGERFENPWFPELNQPSRRDPSLFASKFGVCYMLASSLPSWWVVDRGGGANAAIVRGGRFKMSVTVGVLGPDAASETGQSIKVYGFDPEMVVGPGSTEDP